MVQIVIIGGSFAGIAAALKAKELYPKAEVSVIERQEKLAYMPNSFSWSLKNQMASDNQEFFNKKVVENSGIKLYLGQEVIDIDASHQRLLLDNGHCLVYDRLILAMGSRQMSDYIKGSHLPGVLSCKTYQESQEAKTLLAKAERIAVIGAGQIGIETSETCLKLGKKVYLFEAQESLDFNFFDADFLSPMLNDMKKAGLNLFCQERVHTIEQVDSGLRLVTDCQSVTVDLILLCAGFRPNSTLVKQLPILSPDQTIEVDTYLRTAIPEIFAVGDLIRVPLLSENNLVYRPLINTALKTGSLAAYNLWESTYSLPLSTQLVAHKQYGWYRAALGLTAEEAIFEQDIACIDYQASFSSHVTDQIFIRLVVAKETGRLLGAQALSKQNCLTLFQPLVLAMAEQKTDEDLVFQDFLFSLGQTELFYHLHQIMLKSLVERRS
ncbi:FAD-dependent oxidoreductase [Streptococcus sp. sy004]|uniref:FAD-dependent oxidoreductase n=1 Tax=Streptococcus sp. sy004 TaxID=2600149 RepID=UPI0011B5905A|nr:FAD-dependent oxidoreductase [Streptococcus sp. sy004]TWT09787.1 hypothetical protein FRX54_05790 [Streptococcus sp. sy004]